MKKALVVLLALVCLSAAAFADGPTASWTVTGLYGFGVYSPSAGNRIVAYDYSQVGTNRTRLDLKLTSADGNAGFVNEMQYVGIGPAAVGNPILGNWTVWEVWGKLFNGMLTVKAGQLDDWSFGTKDWFNWGALNGEDAYVGPGVAFMLAPMAGLNVLFFQQIPLLGGSTPLNMNGDQVGFTYDAANIGGVQAGAVLNNSYTTTVGTQVYFGANVTAIPNLKLIEETNVWLLNGNTPISAEVYVSYAMDPLTIGSRFAIFNDTKGTDWGIEPLVTYKVDSNWAVNGIVNIYNYGNNTLGLGGVGKITFYSPVDAGVVGAGNTATTNFGAGASLTYTMSGFTLTAGDYYAAGNNSGNIVYVNADVTL